MRRLFERRGECASPARGDCGSPTGRTNRRHATPAHRGHGAAGCRHPALDRLRPRAVGPAPGARHGRLGRDQRELLEDEEIRTALGLFIVDQLYDSDGVQARLEEELPPRSRGWRVPRRPGSRRSPAATRRGCSARAAALNAWETANRRRTRTLLKIVDEGVQGTLGVARPEVACRGGGGGHRPARRRRPTSCRPTSRSSRSPRPSELDKCASCCTSFKTIVWVLLGLALARLRRRDRAGARPAPDDPERRRLL